MIFKFTPEEGDHIQSIWDEYNEEVKKLEEAQPKNPTEDEHVKLILKKQSMFEAKEEAIEAFVWECQEKRFTPIKEKGKQAILDNAREQLEELVNKIYNITIQEAFGLDAETVKEDGLGVIKDGTLYMSSNHAVAYIKIELKLHINALASDKQGLKDLFMMIMESVNKFPYVNIDEDFLKELETASTYTARDIKDNLANSQYYMSYYGKGTSMLLDITPKNLIPNDLGTMATYSSDKSSVLISGFDRIAKDYNINVHKLFNMAMEEFTTKYHKKEYVPIPEVILSADEFMRSLAWAIDIQPTETPEEAEKELKRAREVRKNRRREVLQYLRYLSSIRSTWTEKINGKVENFTSISLFEKATLWNDKIVLEFGRNMANYLKSRPVTMYPKNLIAIPADNPNPYKIGVRMSPHYFMYGNIDKGIRNILTVETLLSYTELPTMEKLKNEKRDNRRQWKTRILKPFEKALNDLIKYNVLSEWEYIDSNGNSVTEAPRDFIEFSRLRVRYEMIDPPDYRKEIEQTQGQ